MGSAFHQLCPRYSGTLTATYPMAIRLWETFTIFVTYLNVEVHSLHDVRCRLLHHCVENKLINIIIGPLHFITITKFCNEHFSQVLYRYIRTEFCELKNSKSTMHGTNCIPASNNYNRKIRYTILYMTGL